MEIVWTVAAQKAWHDAATYCEETFGRRVTDRFIDRVIKVNTLLVANPYLGKYEPSLEGLSQPYRSLVVHKYYKVVYYIQGDTLYVADFWDTRRNPLDLIGSLR